jgi:hypothetical protein
VTGKAGLIVDILSGMRVASFAIGTADEYQADQGCRSHFQKQPLFPVTHRHETNLHLGKL